MSKKTVFDKHLYKEGMRTLLPFGSILLGLITIFSILFTTGTMLDTSSYYNPDRCLDYVLTDHHAILYFMIIVIVVPILSLKSFHFLTTRNGSDFYHSIPHKKQCIFISFAIAAFTWITFCTIIPMVIPTVVFAVAGYISFSFIEFILVLLHILAAALLVMSAISIACAITGTLITNIITTGLVLFFPRVFIYACRLILCSLCGTYLLGNGFLLGTKPNLVVHSIIAFRNRQYYLYNIKPLIYTLVLCIIYLLLAIYLFERRHSELAMKATLSRKLQAFLCILLGTAFSIIPISVICSIWQYPSEDKASHVFMLVTMYILIMIGMGIYELISTKKARNLIRIIPRTGILAIINIALIGSLYCGKNIVLSNVPSASDISSVSFGFTNPDAQNLFYYGSYTSPFRLDTDTDDLYFVSDDYFKNKSNTYSTNNETVRNIVARGLEASSKHEFVDRPHDVLVTVNTGHKSMERCAIFTNEELATIRDCLVADDAFLSIYRNLPNTKKLWLSWPGSDLSKKDLTELYQIASQELATLDVAQLQQALGDYPTDCINELQFTTTIDSMNVSSTVPISPALPKTHEKYIELVNSKHIGVISTAKDKLESESTMPGKTHYEIHYRIDSKTSYSTDTFDQNILSKDLKEKSVTDFINEMIAVEDKALDYTKEGSSIFEFVLNTYNSDGNVIGRSIKYIQLDNETIKRHCDAIETYILKRDTLNSTSETGLNY